MSVAAIAAAAVGAGVGIYQVAAGSARAKRADEEARRLTSQRKVYQTPKEIIDLVSMAQNNAQTGYSAATEDYLTTQSQQAVAASLDTARMLGADPNELSALLNTGLQNVFRIGSESEVIKMKKFDQLIGATQALAQSRDAEFFSADNLLKDQLQAQQAQAQAGAVAQQSGINAIIGSAANYGTSMLYKQQNKPVTDPVTPLAPYKNPYAFNPTKINPADIPPVEAALAPPVVAPAVASTYPNPNSMNYYIPTRR